MIFIHPRRILIPIQIPRLQPSPRRLIQRLRIHLTIFLQKNLLLNQLLHISKPHRINIQLDILHLIMRDPHTDLGMVESFPMPMQLREQRTELHAKQPFQIDRVVLDFWGLELGHQAEDLQVQDSGF